MQLGGYISGDISNTTFFHLYVSNPFLKIRHCAKMLTGSMLPIILNGENYNVSHQSKTPPTNFLKRN